MREKFLRHQERFGTGEMAMTQSPPGSLPATKPWNLERDGPGHLASIYAMQRQQDSNLWVQTGMFAAANGVLLVALLSAFDKLAHTGDAEIGFGLIGQTMCLCWLLVAARAGTRAIRYKSIARRLQEDLGVPREYLVWGEKEPPGIRSWSSYWTLVFLFLGVWVYVTLLGVGSKDAVSSVVILALTAIILLLAYWSFRTWRNFRWRVQQRGALP